MIVQSAARLSRPQIYKATNTSCKLLTCGSSMHCAVCSQTDLTSAYEQGYSAQSAACPSWSYAGRLAKEGCKILTCGLGLARAVCNLSLMASYMRRSAAPTEGRTSFSASSKWRACTWGLCGCALLAASGALLEPFPMLPPEVSPGPSCACRCSCGQGGNDFKNAES